MNFTQILWRADRDGKITYLDRQWHEYTGFSVQESLGLNFTKAISKSDRDRFLFQWQQAREKQERVEIECNLKNNDGIDRPFIFIAEPLKIGSKQEIEEWIGTFTSILAIKARESVTIDRLKKRNQELDRFSYIVSHDLKAPLRAIANLVEWIENDLQGRLNSQTKQYLQLLRDRVWRMDRLIGGLLDYSRSCYGSVNPELVDLNILLKEVIDSLAPPPSFQVEIIGEMPVFITHRLLLERVFSNLIENGIKHHDRPNGKIKISVEDKDSFYEFTVADDGPGILPQDRDKIFVIFETLATADKLQNTGIGLSIVKKIIEERGGKIELESPIGRGSIFRFIWYKN